METKTLMEEIQTREPQHIHCDHILVPTDGSGQAFKAVNEAIQMAAMTGAELTLLMAIDLNKHVAAFEQVSLSGYVPAELKSTAYQSWLTSCTSSAGDQGAHARRDRQPRRGDL